MTRSRHRIAAAALLAGLLAVTLAPAAVAGDTGGHLRSPVGDWTTRTSGVKQTITFDRQGKVYGDSGCNRFTGGYTIHGDRIEIGPLASTMMACPEPIMNAEQTFLTRLQAAVSYSATAKVLKIYAPKDMIRFRAA